MTITTTYQRSSAALAMLLAALPLLFRYGIPADLPHRVALDGCAQQRMDAEGILAIGEKIPLSTSDIYSLELIHGISDTLAEKILRSRSSISALADYLRPGHKHRAFEVVHGIGIKTALRLSEFLDPLPSGTDSTFSKQNHAPSAAPDCIRNPS